MSFSVFTQADYDIINRDYAALKEIAAKRIRAPKEMVLIQKAFDFANEAHKNVRRRSGEPYMIHPIAVARIVVEDIGLGYKSIIAALLHDVVEDTDYTIEDIRGLFGDKIASLVDGLTKIKTVLDNEDKKKRNDVYAESLQAENFKRILLTLNDDARVVLIKLADRLHNCRTIEYMPEHKRDKILSETMFIFIPLAHRLGLYSIKSEMENIWLKYKEPEAYNEITHAINIKTDETDAKIQKFMEPISSALKDAGFNFEIKMRVKTPYSTWHKMQTKNVSFDQVYDLYAVRIIFTPDADSKETERDQCYHIFSIITGIYRYNASRVRDWVKHPKSNGYEALHCTLMSEFGSWIEVQIRSKRMDDIAEKGIAAHWAYKREGFVSENDSEMDKWLGKVKEILLSNDVNALELLDLIHSDLTSQDIVVFTPKGEQRSIMKGATALDFAYTIHSHVGPKAIAAKVNNKLVPVSYVLKSGDQVEIITAENGEPKIEWLKFLTTRKAKSLVTDYFRDSKPQWVAKGKEILTGVTGNAKVMSDTRTLQILLDDAEINDTEELLFRIGIGIITEESIRKSLSNPLWTKKSSRSKSDLTRYVFASCCHPIPGDPVIGFKTQDGTVEVHKKSCEYAERLATKHGEWIVVPDWSHITGDFPVRLSLKGLDRVGILNDVSHCISQVMGLNIRKVYLNADNGVFDGYIDFLLKDRHTLDAIMSKLSSIDGIKSVARTDL